jgi:hypothetical protein
MSWTRSAALRAGLAGAAGAALILSTVPPLAATAGSGSPDAGDEAAIALATGELTVAWPLDADRVAAVEAARYEQRASRAAEREALEKKRAERKVRQARKERQARRAAEREAASRAAQREAPPARSTVAGERWTTVALNIRTAPNGSVVTTVDARTRLTITNRTEGGWQQVRWDGQDRWVAARYLSTSKPAAPAAPTAPAQPSGPSTAACPHGSGIESGLTANARSVYRAVCNRWPQITGYGGYRPDSGYHGSGRAVDVMVSGPLGWDVANWVRANARSLGVSEVIYAQRIWTVQRAGEGWRAMSDRGSATANHYDHVHVSTY